MNKLNFFFLGFAFLLIGFDLFSSAEAAASAEQGPESAAAAAAEEQGTSFRPGDKVWFWVDSAVHGSYVGPKTIGVVQGFLERYRGIDLYEVSFLRNGMR